MNEVRRLCLGRALLSAPFSEKVTLKKTNDFLKNEFSWSIALSSLKVGRSATRLTVYYAFPY